MAEGAMASLLSNIGEFFTQSVTWLGDVLDVVVQNPVLLIMVVGFSVIGFAVGLLGRLIRI